MSHEIPLLFIALVIIGFLGILADGAIIYAIFRFKKLNTISNIFLANLAIADLLSIIFIPANVVIFALMFYDAPAVYSCLTIQATVLLHTAVVWFGILLCIDWFLASHYPEKCEKFRGRYLYIIGGIWSLILLLFIVSVALCIRNYMYYISGILLGISYAINLLFVIAVLCSKVIQKCRTGSVRHIKLSGRLSVITVITCSYLIGIVNTIVKLCNETSATYTLTIVCLFISVAAILSSSVVILGVLCWLDRDFRMCLFPIGKSSHERFENEVSEIEEDDSVPVINNSTTNCITSNGESHISREL